jgi:hypothetical protein
MNERALNTIIILLLVINLAALITVAARFQPLLRTFVAPGSVPQEVIETEQRLEEERQAGESAVDPVTFTECKRLLSDCRNYCQARSTAEALSSAQSATCYAQCEQSFRFCYEPQSE